MMGLVALLLVNAAVVLGTRWLAARVLGVRGVSFWPRAAGAGSPLAWWKPLAAVAMTACAAYLVAAAWFAAGYVAGGLDTLTTDTQVRPVAGRPAAQAGLQEGDRVVRVAGREVTSWRELAAAIGSHPGERIALEVRRDGQTVTLDAVVGGDGVLGVTPMKLHREVGAAEGAARGLATPWKVFANFASGLSGVVRGQVSGPIALSRNGGDDGTSADLLYQLGVRDTPYELPFAVLVAFLVRVRRNGASPRL